MVVNIAGLDKIKIFFKLYNYIQKNTTFGHPDKMIGSEDQARQLLITHNNDYANFGIFCDLNQDVIESKTYNAIYGNGQPLVEKFVAELRQPLEQPKEHVGDYKTLQEVNTIARKNGVSSIPMGGSIPMGASMPMGDVHPTIVKIPEQNWDIFCRCMDKIIYFKTQNQNKDPFNFTPEICCFIMLGTSRDEVLKMLFDVTDKSISSLISQQMLRDLISSQVDKLQTFTNNGPLLKSLNLLRTRLSSAQEKMISCCQRLTKKYWSQTNLARIPTLENPEALSIKSSELLIILQNLSDPKNKKNSELSKDIYALQVAKSDYEAMAQRFLNALNFPQLINDYLKNTLQQDGMPLNIALAWAIASKRVLRVWKHSNIQQQFSEGSLFKDTTQAVLELEPGFQDLAPIDIFCAPTHRGDQENRYFRLMEVANPIHPLGVVPEAQPPAIIYSSKIAKNSGYDLPIIVKTPKSILSRLKCW